MGARGRLAAPDNVRQLRGNRKPVVPVLKARPGVPNPPTWLDREARAEWTRVVPELERMGILATIDRAILASYCDCWARWVEARKALVDSGVLQPASRKRDGDAVKNPAWQVYRDAGTQHSNLARQLGLTPAARLRLTPPKKDDDDGGDFLK
jgi:P27 family predicted phage terminase small subunit